MKSLPWLQKIMDEATKCGFTGRIQVNFFKGGIQNVNRDESLMPPPEKKEIYFPKKMAETLKNGGF